jgi:hypothetical protein
MSARNVGKGTTTRPELLRNADPEAAEERV